MESEDGSGPDFSYAYGGASAASSWNPALRPDTTDDEPSSNPSALVSKTVEDHSTPALDAENNPAVAQKELGGTLPEHHTSEVEPTSDDDFFDRYGGSDNTAQSQMRQASEAANENGDILTEEQGPHQHENGNQVADALHNGYQSVNGTSEGLAHVQTAEEQPSQEHPEEHPPEELYEHQGETTELEEAMNEDAKIPLVQDAQSTSDDWETSGEVFDLGGKTQDGPIEPILAERKTFEVADKEAHDRMENEPAAQDIDWGNSEDNDLFGTSNAASTGDHGANGELVEASKGASKGNSMWDLALDDDFLPDAEESPETVLPFVIDDEEGFLEDAPAPEPVQRTQTSSSSVNRYAPPAAQAPKPVTNAYGVQSPQFADFSQVDQKRSPNMAYGAFNQPLPPQQSQQQRPGMPGSAQSFADKSKGGYHSPYDLPDDITTTRRKLAPRQISVPAAQPTPPPPRSSSIGASRPPFASMMSAPTFSPPSSSHSAKSPLSGTAGAVPPRPATLLQSPSSDFFAELPVVSKPRSHPHPSARYTPQTGAPAPAPPAPANYAPHQLPPKNRTGSWSSLRNEVLPETDSLVSQLQQPERLLAFPEQPSAPARTNSLPVPPDPAPGSIPTTSRYSPAPPAAPAVNARYSPAPPPAPATSSRYSPAPPSHPPHAPFGRSVSDMGPPKSLPFAPRTSSPLAYQQVPEDESESARLPLGQSPPGGATHDVRQPSIGSLGIPISQSLEQVNEIEESGIESRTAEIAQPSRPPMSSRSETPPPRSVPSSNFGSPRKTANYTPQYQPASPPSAQNVAAPPRSHSQSPGLTMKHSPLGYAPVERAASVQGPSSPSYGNLTQNVANIIPHKGNFSHELDFIEPTDGLVADPLGRWKGQPIFKWGLGGTVITSFPKHIPRYGAGSSKPMIKSSPGEVKIQNIKQTLPLSEEFATFPGPLKSKGKKKEVSAWLGKRIEVLQSEYKAPGFEQRSSAESFGRLQEKLLLWKIMQAFVDHDGLLEGNASAVQAVRKILSLEEGDASEESAASFTTGADLVGISRTNTLSAHSDAVDPRAVDELHKLLTKGDREKAVWHAVDQRLWAHAMLLSSTLNKDVWKQVAQEFVRKEVKKMGGSSQALAVLYEIFAGNWDDCIDQLVPPSARAGFQMVSTARNGASQNALEGLDRWRETLLLVLNNRSDGDVQALLSLGRLLAGYGRVEAAHICFIFARSISRFGGLDDPQADVVLMGADHRTTSDIGRDLESILLSEVFEFGASLSSPTGTYTLPHLQIYKLAHAYSLAEYGYRTEAQQYCDAIFAATKSTTKGSPYYNSSFMVSLDDLNRRLSHSPKDPSSSWISKPSVEKAKGTFFAKFNSFVAGDDSDRVSSQSGNGEVGPFAKIGGDSPAITPSQSNADLYGAYGGYQGGVAALPSAPPTNSRYAPSNAYSPRSSQEQPRGRYDPLGRSSMESSDGPLGARRGSENNMAHHQPSGPYTPSQYSPPASRGQPLRSQSAYLPNQHESSPAATAYGNPYQPGPVAEQPSPSFGYQPFQTNSNDQSSAPPSPPEQQVSNGYEPPSMGGYEPPSYEPYQPDADDEEEKAQQVHKKKSFMDDDDDDDLARRAAELKKKGKSEADRKADDAFRKAAEADAAKGKEGEGQKKGWLSGWFGGKKDANPHQGPIKAKLGEENSFYYDPELKKWVNKKAGAETPSAPLATPPPPRSGPPSRAVSGNSITANHALGQLGSSLPHSMSAPPTRAPTSNPPRSTSMPPPISGAPSRASTPGVPSDGEGKAPTLMPPSLTASGPPSRPSTGMSNASSIDDLLGAPQARKGGTVKKGKRGGRYVDVMAQK